MDVSAKWITVVRLIQGTRHKATTDKWMCCDGKNLPINLRICGLIYTYIHICVGMCLFSKWRYLYV